MKLCKDCKWFYPSVYCKNPVNGVDLVDGEVAVVRATRNRLPFHGNCKPEGLFFEQKEVKSKTLTFFDKINNFFKGV